MRLREAIQVFKDQQKNAAKEKTRTHAPTANPCNDSLLSKTFRAPRMKQREIIGREVIDEIIYRCRKVRDRLILELQARSGMRIGEVLGLRASDVNGRRLTIRRPKSGRSKVVLPAGGNFDAFRRDRAAPPRTGAYSRRM